MYRHAHVGVVLVFCFICSTGFAQVMNQPMTAQRFSGDVLINAKPDQVWNVLTDAKKMTALLHIDLKGPEKRFARAGEVVRVTDSQDAAQMVVTYFAKPKELRIAFDPDNASYICEARWVLTSSGNGTKVMLEERYTESAPQPKEEIASQVKMYDDALKQLKAVAEMK